MPAQQRLRRHDQALAAVSGKDSAQCGEEGAIGRPKTRARLLSTEHRKLVAQNQQFDVLAERVAMAPHEQRQQRREREIREREEHAPMLPELTTAEIENRNLVLEPLRGAGARTAAAERGIQRIRDTHHLASSFLRHSGLSVKLCGYRPILEGGSDGRK